MNNPASSPWRESFKRHFPADSILAACLRGSRDKEGMTQVQLAETTGIPRRHISEMEHSKRSIGKETAKKLAAALKTDYRVFSCNHPIHQTPAEPSQNVAFFAVSSKACILRLFSPFFTLPTHTKGQSSLKLIFA